MISKRNQETANRQQKRADYSADNMGGFHTGMLIMLGVGKGSVLSIDTRSSSFWLFDAVLFVKFSRGDVDAHGTTIVTVSLGAARPASLAALVYFHFAGGVGCGGVGGAGAVWLSGGKVFRRNSSRSAALAGLMAGNSRSAAFWMVKMCS